MQPTPGTLSELFRSLDLTLTIRPAADEPDAWACTLSRPDGGTYEIDSVTIRRPARSRHGESPVPSTTPRRPPVVAGGDIEGDDDSADTEAESEAAARGFLGEEAFALLQELDAAGLE
jgi:hypothetical protein